MTGTRERDGPILQPEKSGGFFGLTGGEWKYLGILFVILAVMLALMTLAGAGKDVAAKPASIATTQADREKAVIKMIQLGMLNWMQACAYTQGRDGVPLETALASCSPKLDIGEPAWRSKK